MKAREGWAAVIAGVTAYELTCPTGETLSEGVDRALEKHPYITMLAIGTTALHLMNLLPKQIDPYHQGLKLIKGGAHVQSSDIT